MIFSYFLALFTLKPGIFGQSESPFIMLTDVTSWQHWLVQVENITSCAGSYFV